MSMVLTFCFFIEILRQLWSCLMSLIHSHLKRVKHGKFNDSLIFLLWLTYVTLLCAGLPSWMRKLQQTSFLLSSEIRLILNHARSALKKLKSMRAVSVFATLKFLPRTMSVLTICSARLPRLFQKSLLTNADQTWILTNKRKQSRLAVVPPADWIDYRSA